MGKRILIRLLNFTIPSSTEISLRDLGKMFASQSYFNVLCRSGCSVTPMRHWWMPRKQSAMQDKSVMPPA